MTAQVAGGGLADGGSVLAPMRVLVFIPALDEDASVGEVIRGVAAAVPTADILVVSDGSADRTEEAARAAGALVAALPFQQGLGAALQTGYMYALRNGYDICAHLDADGQHQPCDLAELIELVRCGGCDLAIGSRYRVPTTAALLDERSYRPTVSRRIGIALFRRLLSFTTRHRFTDATSGFRAANRRVIRLFAASYSPDFHELESLQRAVRVGVRIQELPVTMLPRSAGRSKITPMRSAFFVFKGLMVVGIGSFRSHQPEGPLSVASDPATQG
jgi:glycosyltransferase involved in cell wall biosynthesis